jgi:hypothetical protein
MSVNSNNSNTDPKLFLVQGHLSEIHVERGRENLLQKIDQHYKSKAVISSAGAVVGDMFGQVASAASLVMYDGEDTQNFACLIDDRLIFGQFGGAEWLTEDHFVKVVVSNQEGVLFAHAVIDEAVGTLWIGHPWGSKAESLANWKIAIWCYCFAMFCSVLISFIFDGWSSKSVEFIAFTAVFGALLCFGMALWNSHTMKALADPSTEMFRLLGFVKPESVNLNGYQLSLLNDKSYRALGRTRNQIVDMNECQTKNVFYYRQAIEDGKLSMLVN